MFSVSSAPSVNWGLVCRVKVRWRKPAGTEDPPKKLQDSTEDRSLRRLRVDSGVEASLLDAPDKFGFGAKQTASKSGRRRKKKEKQTQQEDLQFTSADFRHSRRTIRLGKKKRTSPRALSGEREREERRERDDNGGKWETGTRGGKGVLAAQIVRNLWSGLDGQRKLDKANRRVWREVQTAQPGATKMVQPVRKSGSGVAALAAVW